MNLDDIKRSGASLAIRAELNTQLRIATDLLKEDKYTQLERVCVNLLPLAAELVKLNPKQP